MVDYLSHLSELLLAIVVKYPFVSLIHRLMRSNTGRGCNCNSFSVHDVVNHAAKQVLPNAPVYQYHADYKDVFPMPYGLPLQPSSCRCIGDNPGSMQHG